MLSAGGAWEGEGERGSAAVESVAAIVVLLVLVLAVVEIAFALYARNVVIASAHEGARAGIELGRSPSEARRVAEATTRRAAGGLVRDLAVAVEVRRASGRAFVRVQLDGWLRGFGPVPLPMRMRASATSSREVLLR